MHGKLCKCVTSRDPRRSKTYQIFGSSKNGSWALVDARNFFFFDLLIRACMASFANVLLAATLEDIKLGQIFGS